MKQLVIKKASTGSFENGDLWRGVERVVFIDSTWQQTSGILRHEAVRSLTCVKLTAADTQFWR